MSVRKIVLRTIAFATAAGGGLTALQQGGLGAFPGRAEVASTASVMPEGPVQTTPDSDVDARTPNDASARSERPVREDAQAQDPIPTHAALSPLGLPCGLSLTADAMPGAMVALDIMEPCAPNARVTVIHGALSFTSRTDTMGLLTLDVPALETPAFFTIRLDDGTEATALAGVPDLIDHHRVAIAWDEDRSLQLHAFERGAEFGAPGHIWQDAPGSVADAMIGAGGFLTVLGDASVATPRLTQIYTAPRALRDELAVSVEVPITEGNCGQPVRAESLQIGPGGQITTRPVTLTLPGCDAVGELLLLQNLFMDLRFASN
jgi:hypothetical protein